MTHVQVSNIRPSGKRKVWFSGSQTAYAIWKRAHLIPDDAEIAHIKGSEGGAGRELIGRFDTGSGNGNGECKHLRNGCFSSKRGDNV